MSRIHDALDFYANRGWRKSEDGQRVPSRELLLDQGSLAESAIHAGPSEIQPENVVLAVYRVSAIEIADALVDLLQAKNQQPGEARNMRIGKACVKLQNAEHRIRSVTGRS